MENKTTYIDKQGLGFNHRLKEHKKIRFQHIENTANSTQYI